MNIYRPDKAAFHKIHQRAESATRHSRELERRSREISEQTRKNLEHAARVLACSSKIKYELQ